METLGRQVWSSEIKDKTGDTCLGEVCIKLALKTMAVNKLVWGESEGRQRKEQAQARGAGVAQHWEVVREVSTEIDKDPPLRVWCQGRHEKKVFQGLNCIKCFQEGK